VETAKLPRAGRLRQRFRSLQSRGFLALIKLLGMRSLVFAMGDAIEISFNNIFG
jgi:hypothetical protein